ncbi:class I SAM-dependent methyltransferase [Candidatus Woesearchaeota archaeon]|nr:class I SAM-dependent methyltransferase [Candidatus Woesearchaeota archaeon]
MMIEESKLIFSLCEDCKNKKILNLCSSDENFYKNIQPHIWNNLLKPLKKNNTLINVDIKKDKGVDIVSDCCDMYMIKDESYDVVLFCSGIEHVNTPEKVISEINRILKMDGFVIFSAPGSFPKHNDPIDNLLRFPDKESWIKFLNNEWEILNYKKTKPIEAKSFYDFNKLVYVTIVKCIKNKTENEKIHSPL